MSEMVDNLWYLAASKPRQDARATANLRNQGINVLSPKIKVKKLRSGKRVITDEPMFPGYLFIRISLNDKRWSKVRSTFGVRDWVRFSGKPAKVPMDVIDVIASLDLKQDPKFVDNTLQKGQKIKITEGPFAGLSGIFEAENGTQRSIVLIEFLGKLNRLTVQNDALVVE